MPAVGARTPSWAQYQVVRGFSMARLPLYSQTLHGEPCAHREHRRAGDFASRRVPPAPAVKLFVAFRHRVVVAVVVIMAAPSPRAPSGVSGGFAPSPAVWRHLRSSPRRSCLRVMKWTRAAKDASARGHARVRRPTHDCANLTCAASASAARSLQQLSPTQQHP